MKISKEMVDEFNAKLSFYGSCFLLKLEPCEVRENTCCRVVLKDDIFVDSYILNLANSFYDMVEVFFREKGIYDIKYNNTRSVFTRGADRTTKE